MGRILAPVAAAVLTGALILSLGLFGDSNEEPPPAGPNKEPATSLADAAEQLEASAETVAIPRLDQWRHTHTATLNPEKGKKEREHWVRADYDQAAYYIGESLQISDGAGADMNELSYETDFTSMVDLSEFLADLPEDPAAARDLIYGLVDANKPDFVTLECAKEADCRAARTEPWNRHASAFHMIGELLTVAGATRGRTSEAFPRTRRNPRRPRRRSHHRLHPQRRPSSLLAPTIRKPPGHQNSTRTSLTIDPQTSTFRGALGYNLELIPDTPTSGTAILDSGFVDRPGQRP